MDTVPIKNPCANRETGTGGLAIYSIVCNVYLVGYISDLITQTFCNVVVGKCIKPRVLVS